MLREFGCQVERAEIFADGTLHPLMSHLPADTASLKFKYTNIQGLDAIAVQCRVL